MAQYHIRFERAGRVIEERTCIDEPKDSLDQQAKSAVEAGIADRAEVRDVNGVLLFQWPRTVSRA